MTCCVFSMASVAKAFTLGFFDCASASLLSAIANRSTPPILSTRSGLKNGLFRAGKSGTVDAFALPESSADVGVGPPLVAFSQPVRPMPQIRSTASVALNVSRKVIISDSYGVDFVAASAASGNRHCPRAPPQNRDLFRPARKGKRVTMGPMSDLRVVEMGSLIAGPFCGQILGDFGAEVVKLEDPKSGDPMRQWGRSLPGGHSPWWPVIGRNKKSVTLDLRSREGQSLARTLINRADVVIENFRPGTMEKWDLSYESLAADNPGLIMARVSGFGQTGPYAGRAGYGLIGEAMGGLRAITGEADRPPARAGVSIGDSLAAVHAVMGILMALHARRSSGRGQIVDAAIYESVLAMMENMITEYDITGYVRERSGSILPGIAPSNVYPAAGGEMILIGGNGDNVFRRLAAIMGRPELAEDPRFVSPRRQGREPDHS